MKYDLVHFVGSDCHNLTSRVSRIGEAYNYVSKKMDEAYADQLFIEIPRKLLADAKKRMERTSKMEQQNLQNNDEIEIDVLELFHVLLDKIWVIILAGAVAALAVVAATILFITPQYQSATKMYVLSKQDSNTLTSQDMQTCLSLTKDYAELIKSRTVTEGVITQLNLDMTHEQLLSKMTVDSATDTRILSISVRDADPYVACEIANAIRDVAANHIKNVMDIDAVNVVETANIPENKISPSVKKNGMVGGIAGVAIAIAIILITYLSNDTIKTQEDVERYLGLSTLGTIPMSEADRKNKNKKKHKKQKRSKGRR